MNSTDEPGYPKTPVDCLISELGELFQGGVWRSQDEHEKAFWARVAQFRAEVAENDESSRETC